MHREISFSELALQLQKMKYQPLLNCMELIELFRFYKEKWILTIKVTIVKQYRNMKLIDLMGNGKQPQKARLLTST